MRNFAYCVSDWEAVKGQVGLCFVWVMSFVNESDVRTDWLSGTKVTTVDDVVGLVVFWDSRVTRAVVIVSMVVQSSSSSFMRARVRVVAWVTQMLVWFEWW